MSKSKVEVVLILEHDDVYDDDALHRAVEAGIEGMTLTEDLAAKTSIVVDEVDTIWVKGA